jgi:ABC-type polysaccharide transport system permease subunit
MEEGATDTWRSLTRVTIPRFMAAAVVVVVMVAVIVLECGLERWMRC